MNIHTHTHTHTSVHVEGVESLWRSFRSVFRKAVDRSLHNRKFCPYVGVLSPTFAKSHVPRLVVSKRLERGINIVHKNNYKISLVQDDSNH